MFLQFPHFRAPTALSFSDALFGLLVEYFFCTFPLEKKDFFGKYYLPHKKSFRRVCLLTAQLSSGRNKIGKLQIQSNDWSTRVPYQKEILHKNKMQHINKCHGMFTENFSHCRTPLVATTLLPKMNEVNLAGSSGSPSKKRKKFGRSATQLSS